MVFNSYTFWIFFIVVVLLYFRMRRIGQNVMLLIASYLFYGYWDWRFLILIILSTFVDFYIARGLDHFKDQRARRGLLAFSICLELGLLGFFKYYNFFSREFAEMLGHFGIACHPASLNVILPVGISFYTFQGMSYTIDVYRRDLPAARNLLDFALYIAFFPQLVAGPIERSSNMIHQFQVPRTVRFDDVVEGIYYCILGMFMKVVIADNLAPLVNHIFAQPASGLRGGECWAGVYSFAFQIYGDFSGYSAIAKGTAQLLGFRLMDNFRLPYFAETPSDFWSRWHISLSTWLRDYLYIPLGGNRLGRWKTYRNLMLTMVLGGLWHGANWTYIAWGTFHGLLLCVYRLFGDVRGKRPDAPLPVRFLKKVFFFHLVCIGWLFFRAGSIDQAWTMLVRMLTDWHTTQIGWAMAALIAFYALPVLLYEAWLHRSGDDMLKLTKVHWSARAAAYGYMVMMLLVLKPAVPADFIYFQF